MGREKRQSRQFVCIAKVQFPPSLCALVPVDILLSQHPPHAHMHTSTLRTCIIARDNALPHVQWQKEKYSHIISHVRVCLSFFSTLFLRCHVGRRLIYSRLHYPCSTAHMDNLTTHPFKAPRIRIGRAKRQSFLFLRG